MTIRRPELPRTAAARWRGAQLLILVLFLASCAAVPPVGPGAGPTPDAPFAVDGRLSARHAGDAVTGNFSWRHAPPRDDLVLSTPLGQAIAEITGNSDQGRLDVRTGDGHRVEASGWEALTQKAFGFPLPVAGLAAWIRGVPRGGAPFAIEPDASGRTAVLRQDGWEIVYGYADGPVPSRLRLVYPDIEIRIVVDRWLPPAALPE